MNWECSTIKNIFRIFYTVKYFYDVLFSVSTAQLEMQFQVQSESKHISTVGLITCFLVRHRSYSWHGCRVSFAVAVYSSICCNSLYCVVQKSPCLVCLCQTLPFNMLIYTYTLRFSDWKLNLPVIIVRGQISVSQVKCEVIIFCFLDPLYILVNI